MKRRLVKKASRICREQPQRAKACHIRIAMKGFRLSLRKMTPAERYAVEWAMKQAGRRCTSPLQIVGEQGRELVLDPRGNVRGTDGKLYDINMKPIAE